MTSRERLAEILIAVGVALGAGAMALLMEWDRSFSWLAVAIAVGCYAAASRVEFPVVAGWTDPTQLMFVVMLFAAPAPLVPALVISAFALGRFPDYLSSRLHPERSVLAFGDSLYAFAPAAVFALADVTTPLQSEWWIYAAAFGAQIATDALAYALRDWLAGGQRPSIGTLVGSGWAFGVDLLLSLLGVLVAIAVAATNPGAVVLVLPLFALFWLFAQDRRARIEGAVELSRAYRGTAFLLGDVIEYDHAYTGEHSRNVVELSVGVAERMGLSADQCRSVEFAALLHDVGKIAVPKEIIDKPGPLDDAEWNVMRRHTIDGQRMLERVGGALASVGVIVRASHEHYDGRGYPDGLRGRQIPIEARIVSCCDAFSAMTTDRSYRRARPIDDALAELRACAGTQFDPTVVRVLIELLEVTGQVRDAREREALGDRGVFGASRPEETSDSDRAMLARA